MCQREVQLVQHRSQQRTVQGRLGAEGLRRRRPTAEPIDYVGPVAALCPGVRGIEPLRRCLNVGEVVLVWRRLRRLNVIFGGDNVIEIYRITVLVIRFVRWGHGHVVINS